MPSPSTGAMTSATNAKTTYTRGGGERADDGREGPPEAMAGGGRGGGGGRGRGVPAGKEQLRRNLSLLKKKMHSQAGSRRSQVGGTGVGGASMFFCLVPGSGLSAFLLARVCDGIAQVGLGLLHATHRPVRAQGCGTAARSGFT